MPAEWVLAAIPWAELNGSTITLPSIGTIPVVVVTDWEGEWPEPTKP